MRDAWLTGLIHATIHDPPGDPPHSGVDLDRAWCGSTSIRLARSWAGIAVFNLRAAPISSGPCGSTAPSAGLGAESGGSAAAIRGTPAVTTRRRRPSRRPEQACAVPAINRYDAALCRNCASLFRPTGSDRKMSDRKMGKENWGREYGFHFLFHHFLFPHLSVIHLSLCSNSRSFRKLMTSQSSPFSLPLGVSKTMGTLRKRRSRSSQPKGLGADLAAADVGVTIDAAAAVLHAVVEVESADPIEPDDLVELLHRRPIIGRGSRSCSRRRRRGTYRSRRPAGCCLSRPPGSQPGARIASRASCPGRPWFPAGCRPPYSSHSAVMVTHHGGA